MTYPGISASTGFRASLAADKVDTKACGVVTVKILGGGLKGEGTAAAVVPGIPLSPSLLLLAHFVRRMTVATCFCFCSLMQYCEESCIAEKSWVEMGGPGPDEGERWEGYGQLSVTPFAFRNALPLPPVKFICSSSHAPNITG